MDNTLSSYLLSSSFMIVILVILAARSFSAITTPQSRRRTLILIGVTAAYVLIDFIFIACHLNAGKISHVTWKIVSFVFYLVYTLQPFMWHIFVRNFVGSTFGKTFRKLELIPIVLLLIMVVATPFTGALYSFDANNMYQRGPLYPVYSVLNYFYYAESVLDLLIIMLNKREKEERYALRTMLISLVMLIGAYVNGSIIPSGTIFPFMPFCSVVTTMLAFYFIATKDSEKYKEDKERQLREAVQEAQEANQAKSAFLSRVSHDVRTPMNAVINLTELARQEPDRDVVNQYLDQMAISGKFLLGLINDILDMSRIESGELKLQKETLTRGEFLTTVETVVKPLMDEHHINFHPEVDPGQYTISVDKLRFNQIFFNLLSNAAKFTPDGGDVWFNVENLTPKGNMLPIRFVIRDNGIGMSEEFQKNLFQPFQQEHNELIDKRQGSGLGLSIVKNLVDAMGGTITVKSKKGEGTEFVVFLEVEIVNREDDDGTPIYESAEAKEAAETAADEKAADDAAQAENLKGLRVLLVEDNEVNIYVAKIILEQAGCVVTTAENGKAAVETFAASEPNSFDAILMDIRMPVMDGLEASRKIRALGRPDAENIPIIAMTADAFNEERSQTFDAGMNYHLTKPIDTKQLYGVLSCCARRPENA